MKTISDRIFELLKEQKMSQKEFAKRTGIAESSISDWKKKRTNPADAKAEGKAEDILEVLLSKGEVSEALKMKIFSEKDLDILGDHFKKAIAVSSVKEFEAAICD